MFVPSPAVSGGRATLPKSASRNRVLLVSYHFPPEPAAGALRPSFLARYLPQFGWEATVLTTGAARGVDGDAVVVPAPDLFERFMRPRAAADDVAPAAARAMRRLIRWPKELCKSLLLFPDRAAGWIPAAIARALEITRRQPFDAVLSQSPPVSAHIVACVAALRRGLPWVADYHDLWHGNPYVERGVLRARIEFELERWLRRHASEITAVSTDLLARQAHVFGETASEAIPAAFDPTEWDAVRDVRPKDFRLTYAGTLYEGRRRLDMLLSAIVRLRSEADPAGSAARVDYYGPDGPLVRRLAAERELSDVVVCHGITERRHVLPALRQSAALVVLSSMDPDTVSELGSKIFECVGARRPIIAIGPRGSAVQAFVERHALGWFAWDDHTTADAVRAAHARFAAGRFAPDSVGLTDDVITAQEVARRFARVLDRAVNSRGPLTLYFPA
jgi:glycosyltransferase involved in cell wall biosynthesis